MAQTIIYIKHYPEDTASANLQCEECGQEFKRQCDLSRHMNRKVPCTVKTSRSTKMVIPKAVKRAVWMKFYPNSKQGECCSCKRIVYDDDFQTAHIIPESKGGATVVDNLMISCKPCNTSCGTKNMNDFNQMLKSENKNSTNTVNNPLPVDQPPVSIVTTPISDPSVVNKETHTTELSTTSLSITEQNPEQKNTDNTDKPNKTDYIAKLQKNYLAKSLEDSLYLLLQKEPSQWGHSYEALQAAAKQKLFEIDMVQKAIDAELNKF